MTQAKKMKKATLLGLVPVFALVVLAGFAFISCDTGSAPDPATGPTSQYDPLFDDPQPGITARVSPSTITVPDPVTLGVGRTNILATYRDPSGNPQEGLQMNFTSDPPTGNIRFFPTASFTDGNGSASAEVVVAVGTPTGSFALVAYTSPASGGPNERGQTVLKVVEGEFVVTPGVPAGPSNPADQCTLLGCVGFVPPVDTGDVAYASSGPLTSNLGTPVEYRYDCGNGTFSNNVPAQASGFCRYTSSGTYVVRAQAITQGTNIASDWSGGLTITVTDTP